MGKIGDFVSQHSEIHTKMMLFKKIATFCQTFLKNRQNYDDNIDPRCGVDQRLVLSD
jgi:hypothetical protein